MAPPRLVRDETSERRFEEGFLAYQRGDLLGALILFEESFRLDPDFEVALLNYARTLRALGLGEGASERVIRLASEANGLPAGQEGHEERVREERAATARRARGGRADGRPNGRPNGRAACP